VSRPVSPVVIAVSLFPCLVYSPNFPTTDPAPASLPTEDESTSSLRLTLLDTSIPLFKRYRAMFALRNIVARFSGVKGKEDEAKAGVQALAAGFKDGSALFRSV
jgi:deoxyhypusine monooxygenase